VPPWICAATAALEIVESRLHQRGTGKYLVAGDASADGRPGKVMSCWSEYLRKSLEHEVVWTGLFTLRFCGCWLLKGPAAQRCRPSLRECLAAEKTVSRYGDSRRRVEEGVSTTETGISAV